MKTTIKIISKLAATALVAVIMFTGYGDGMKKKLVKMYEYCRYQIAEEQVETKEVNHGRLMNMVSLEKEIFR